ncbi:hypothetical protein J1605_012311 [Eschrichtius robustus]|uniref:Uncharacterized protein n=1 Tax=Eschrichtius robustus TaxID=9764 RepID=A0AB34GJI7_ESCRO|nr:hypothetical protein J1605_012311 [Eschrichtius robustus]
MPASTLTGDPNTILDQTVAQRKAYSEHGLGSTEGPPGLSVDRALQGLTGQGGCTHRPGGLPGQGRPTCPPGVGLRSSAAWTTAAPLPPSLHGLLLVRSRAFLSVAGLLCVLWLCILTGLLLFLVTLTCHDPNSPNGFSLGPFQCQPLSQQGHP